MSEAIPLVYKNLRKAVQSCDIDFLLFWCHASRWTAGWQPVLERRRAPSSTHRKRGVKSGTYHPPSNRLSKGECHKPMCRICNSMIFNANLEVWAITSPRQQKLKSGQSIPPLLSQNHAGSPSIFQCKVCRRTVTSCCNFFGICFA